MYIQYVGEVGILLLRSGTFIIVFSLFLDSSIEMITRENKSAKHNLITKVLKKCWDPSYLIIIWSMNLKKKMAI